MKYKVILKVEIDADYYLGKINYVCVNYSDWDDLVYECVDFEVLGIEEIEDPNEDLTSRVMWLIRIFKKALLEELKFESEEKKIDFLFKTYYLFLCQS